MQCRQLSCTDILSRMETRLDNNATNEFLQFLDESSYDTKNISNDAEKGDAQPLTKVEKNAMNEIMERAQSSHIPHAETDNPALMAKHEVVRKGVERPSRHNGHGETHQAQPDGLGLEKSAREQPHHTARTKMETLQQ